MKVALFEVAVLDHVSSNTDFDYWWRQPSHSGSHYSGVSGAQYNSNSSMLLPAMSPGQAVTAGKFNRFDKSAHNLGLLRSRMALGLEELYSRFPATRMVCALSTGRSAAADSARILDHLGRNHSTGHG